MPRGVVAEFVSLAGVMEKHSGTMLFWNAE
jgi:hypothetical protein